MIILGINDGHQSSAALCIDGALVAAVAEERFTRRKNEHGYPQHSIEACLRIANIKSSDVDKVAVATKLLPPSYFLIRRDSDFSIRDFWKEQTEYWYPKIYKGENPSYLKIFKEHLKEENFVYDKTLLTSNDNGEEMQEARRVYIEKNLSINRSNIDFKDHHEAHAWYGLAACPMNYKEKQLIFTADGFGDGCNASIWVSSENNLKKLNSTDQCHIGRMYRYTTLMLGMKPAEHEYKVMGLAPYANKNYSKKAYDIFAETLQVNGLDFTYKKRPKDNFFYFHDKLKSERFDAIAYGIQKRTEELLCKWINNGINKTNIKNIIFSGGVAQNIKANKCIWELNEVNNLFVPPGPHDESLSIGAAFMEEAQHNTLKKPEERFINAYLGTSYKTSNIKPILKKYSDKTGVKIEKFTEKKGAELLASGNILARFDGRMEFGARALGNRSILANPQDPSVIQKINDTVKFRDFWMPFAPSILEEQFNNYMNNPKKLDSPYMMLGFDSTDKGKESISAALHPYDKTGRPHIVHKSTNKKYYNLISSFKENTGIGSLLNTSFNLHGEPVVESPEDALSAFSRCKLNNLIMDEWLLSKN